MTVPYPKNLLIFITNLLIRTLNLTLNLNFSDADLRYRCLSNITRRYWLMFEIQLQFDQQNSEYDDHLNINPSRLRLKNALLN